MVEEVTHHEDLSVNDRIVERVQEIPDILGRISQTHRNRYLVNNLYKSHITGDSEMSKYQVDTNLRFDDDGFLDNGECWLMEEIGDEEMQVNLSIESSVDRDDDYAPTKEYSVVVAKKGEGENIKVPSTPDPTEHAGSQNPEYREEISHRGFIVKVQFKGEKVKVGQSSVGYFSWGSRPGVYPNRVYKGTDFGLEVVEYALATTDRILGNTIKSRPSESQNTTSSRTPITSRYRGTTQ